MLYDQHCSMLDTLSAVDRLHSKKRLSFTGKVSPKLHSYPILCRARSCTYILVMRICRYIGYTDYPLTWLLYSLFKALWHIKGNEYMQIQHSHVHVCCPSKESAVGWVESLTPNSQFPSNRKYTHDRSVNIINT